MNTGGPRVIAHRGASADCPENTLTAFDEALRQRAAGIELDLQLTRDGIPVVYHDRTLLRAGGGRRRVFRLDLTEIRRLDAGRAGLHIPTLEQVLDRYGRKTRLLLEIKARRGAWADDRHLELARAVATLIRERALEGNTMILCFDPEVLSACAELVPEVRRVLNVKPARRLGASARRWLPRLAAVSADVRTVTPAFGRAVRNEGRTLFVHTCNHARAVDRALAAGASSIMTDRPGWLIDHLERSS